MNPFNEYKRNYLITGFITAMIYAFVISNQPLFNRALDGLIYGCIICFMGILLWYMFRFTLPKIYTSIYQATFLICLSLITSLVVVGLEMFVMYISFPATFTSYVTTIPARIFVTLLLFVIMWLFYNIYSRRNIPNNNNCDEEKQPVSASPQTIDRITVRSGQKIKIIPVNEIMYIKAEGDYISIHSTEGNWLKEQTMKYSEEILPPDNFIRIHRSYIINISFISRIERYGERQQIILHNQEKIKISMARYQVLRQRLGI